MCNGRAAQATCSCTRPPAAYLYTNLDRHSLWHARMARRLASLLHCCPCILLYAAFQEHADMLMHTDRPTVSGRTQAHTRAHTKKGSSSSPLSHASYLAHSLAVRDASLCGAAGADALQPPQARQDLLEGGRLLRNLHAVMWGWGGGWGGEPGGRAGGEGCGPRIFCNTMVYNQILPASCRIVCNAPLGTLQG